MPNKIIYKYRTINSKTEELLENSEFYFSFPYSFNDPFDCCIFNKYKGSKEAWNSYIDKYYFDNEEKKNLIETLESVNYDSKKLDEMFFFVRKSIREEYPFIINCFTELKDNILMWAHYANQHKGICIGFRSDKLNKKLFLEMDDKVNYESPFNNLLLYNVKYQINSPKIYNPLKDNNISLFNFYITKSKSWSYEKEYRTFIKWELFKKQVFKFKKEILNEIIFGLYTDVDNIKKIMKIVKEKYINYGIDVKFLKAIKSEYKYKINFEPIEEKNLIKYHYY